MFYPYKFWHSLVNPSIFANVLDNDHEVRGYKKRVAFIFVLTLLLFAARNFWGVGTEGLTGIFALGDNNTYATARILSLTGAIIFGAIYFAFHYFGISYALSILTEIPYAAVRRVQLFVIAFYLIEKTIVFAAFYNAGFTANLSFLSIAPIVAQFTTEDFVLFTLNQITLFSVIAIIIQYQFLNKFIEPAKHKGLLIRIIAVHAALAIIVGLLSALPLQEWLLRGLS